MLLDALHDIARHLHRNSQMAVKRDEPGQESITIRVPKEWLTALDTWRAAQSVPPKRGDVIRLSVMQFIKTHNKR
jgi:hypothetical protein